jgi:DNA-binding MarR family transcriptional regulator
MMTMFQFQNLLSAPNEPEAPVDDQPSYSEDESTQPTQSTSIQSSPLSAPAGSTLTDPSSSAITKSISVTPQAQLSALQMQSSAQQDQVGFIHSLLIKAQAKIQSNKQKKLNEIIQLAQKKQIIKNEDVQKLLRISSATATRYLAKLVEQGHLIRVGSPRDAKYQFVS